MSDFTEDTLTDAVLAQVAGAKDARTREIVTSLIKHLHAFVRDIEPTDAEWLKATELLTELGKRDEFILFSDIMGASMMVDVINHRVPDGATESTVLGPFYIEGAPDLAPGETIAHEVAGDPVVVAGRVTAPDGTPIEGAVLDVWQSAPHGLYENQDPNQPDMNMRGRFRTDASGAYLFKTKKPGSYPIPHEGPVGRTLDALGRHPFRPAHIHFIITADGYEPLTTQVFVDGDEYLDSDAVFAVKQSLIGEWVRHDAADEAVKLGVTAPFYTLDYDFGLKPVD